MNKRRIVIVGGVAGGASAATRVQGRMNESAEIVLLEKDEHVSFSPIVDFLITLEAKLKNAPSR